MKTKICTINAASFFFALLAFFALPLASWGATPSGSTSERTMDMNPKPLDGVNIEAVELYPNLREHMLGVGVGIYPFNAYYLGLILNANYLYHLNPATAWEILNINYAYSVQNDLTTELANNYRVNPKEIARLSFIVSSTGHFTFLNGKFVLMKNYIRYFRMSGIGGLGLTMTNQTSSIAPQFGLRFEVYSSQGQSWFLDIRDSLAISSFTNYVTFVSGLNFAL